MTVIYPSPIFGPVKSRRLGISLGVNLLPADGKCCTFDCIYCECGFNADHRPKQKMPTRDDVRMALEAQLRRMQLEGSGLDVITFAGNGEPTLHPQFPEIINDTLALRNLYFPEAKVSVLNNATQIVNQRVFEALCLVDNNICKLDTINTGYISLVDRCGATYDVERIIERLKEFGNRCIIQTMFMKGEYQQQDVDNTTDMFVTPWLEAVRSIAPREVMIYTIDRETPATGLQKATPAELDSIAERVRAAGISCSVAY